ncbi:MAG: hypothetical protein LBC41_12840 [Clostridiales bacterium]|nr:hypothetical protein [Clostridiales bacterium]MDR2751537.1 hypothetical protein [Clostridiales bacterium]
MSKKTALILVVTIISVLAVVIVLLANKNGTEGARQAWESLKARLPKKEKEVVESEAV